MKESVLTESQNLTVIKNAEQIEITLPLKERYVGLLRLVVSGIGIRTNCNYDEIEDIKLAVNEAFLLALKSATKRESSINLKFMVSSKEITSYIPVKPQEIDEEDLGLFLIKGVMDGTAFEVIENLTYLIISKKISKGGK